MSNINFDITLCNYDLKAGIPVVIFNLLREAIKDDSINIQPYFIASSVNEDSVKYMSKVGIKPLVIINRLFNGGIKDFLIPYYPNKKLSIDDNSITIFPGNSIPIGNVKGKKILILHDVIPLALKEKKTTIKKYLGERIMAYLMKRSVKKSDIVITVSDYSKSDIIKYTKCKKDKIHVMPLGVERFVVDESKKADIKEKYNLPDEYIIYIGGVSERKNVSRLLIAFDQLVNDPSFNKKHELVVVGNMNILNMLIDSLKLSSKAVSRIRFPGFIDEEDKGYIYEMADCSVYPSCYEGFGLPAIEAMEAGTPVIASNITSIPEVVGEAALLCDPFSVEDIREKLKMVLNNQVLRKELIKKGHERAKLYKWENSYKVLKRVIDVLQE